MLSPEERVISREQAFVILERLDQVEAHLEHLRDGVRRSWLMSMASRPRDRVAERRRSGTRTARRALSRGCIAVRLGLRSMPGSLTGMSQRFRGLPVTGSADEGDQNAQGHRRAARDHSVTSRATEGD